MDKNLLIVLGFLLLCILLSLDKKEGFIEINKDAFEAQCAQGHSSCIINISGGGEGYLCSTNSNRSYYNIISPDGVDMTENIFSNIFSEISLNETTPCNDAVAYHDNNTLFIGPCTSSGGEFELSGCSPLCSAPSAGTASSMYPGYDLSRTQSIKIPPGEPQDESSISCQLDGYTHAKNVCFDKNTGDITSQSQSDCIASENGVWYGGGTDEEQPVQISCVPGGNFVPIGCETLCQSRVTSSDEYIINSGEFNEDSTPSDFRNLYDQNKELMQITTNRPEGDGPVEPNIITGSPYSIQENTGGGLNPANFGVTVSPGSVTDSDDHITVFEGTGGASPCNPNDPNSDIRGKYFVSGLFPACSDDEECLNFNITYTPEEYIANDETRPPFTLEELKNKLPTDIFQGEGEADLDQYKESLYYFRGHKGPDGNYNVEGQIRCDINQDSRYGCAIIDDQVIEANNASLRRLEGGYNINENKLCTFQGLVSGWVMRDDITMLEALQHCNNVGDDCVGVEKVSPENDNKINLIRLRPPNMRMPDEEGAKCYLKR